MLLKTESAKRILSLLETALGSYTSYGYENDFRCPFCAERKSDHIGTLHVNIKKNAAICHSCHFGTRNVLHIIRDVVGYMPYDEDAEKDMVALGVSRKQFKQRVRRKLWAKREDAKIVPLPEDFKRLLLPAVGVGANIMYRYLQHRGMTDDQIDAYGIGWCARGEYAGFVVFPFYQGGYPVYFSTRNVIAHSPKKVLNPEEDRRWYLFNYDRAMKHSHILIVEGALDAIRTGTNAVAIMGKTVRDEQLDLLARDSVEEVTVILDDDAHDDTLNMCERLRDRLNKKVTYVLLEEGDPADNAERLPRLLKSRKELSFGQLVRRKMIKISRARTPGTDWEPTKSFQDRVRTMLDPSDE